MSSGDVWRFLTNVERDLQSAHRNLTEARASLAALGMPDERPRVVCPECGLALQGGEVRLSEHRYVVHDVPLPEGVE